MSSTVDGGGDASASDATSSSDASAPEDGKAPACKAPLADCNGDGACDTSTDTDPKNCGACAHDCGGGACMGGKCQATDSSATRCTGRATRSSATTPPGPSRSCSSMGPSVDATYDAIYACAVGGCGGVGMPLGGTGPGIMTGKILDMKADASGLYWVERLGTVGRIMRCALPGCPMGSQVLAASQDQPVAIVTDEAFVYWVNAGSGTNGTVARVAK